MQTPAAASPPFTVTLHEGYCAGRFSAMASPCELLVAGDDLALAARLTRIVHDESLRIEARFSRYRDDNIVAQINRAAGAPVPVDDEVLRLLSYADTCWQISGGAFDITSGVLRRAWRFDGSDRLPAPHVIDALLPLVGWDKVRIDGATVTLPAGMEIDFGGIGKEYAVDRALQLASAETDRALLVNFGGDLACNGTAAPALLAEDAGIGGNNRATRTWTVGVEAPGGGVAKLLRFRAGALATSGDARRFLLKDGVRYGHILDPRTGWPVRDAPRSVTVVAPTCIEAGTLSTLAILRGREAGEFLAAQGVQHWILW
jgi:thiamine biosynthesis lipoprotein